VFAALPNGPDLITGTLPKSLGSAKRSVNVDGLTFESTSSTADGYYWELPASSPLYSPTTKLSAIVFGSTVQGVSGAFLSVPYGTGWEGPYASFTLYPLSTNQVRFLFAYSSSAFSFKDFAAGYIASTGRAVYGITRNAENVIAYRNGEQIDSGTSLSASAIDWGAKQPLTLFNRSSSSVGEGRVGASAVVLIFGRELSAGDMRSLSVNPWQIFAPRRIDIPAPAAAATAPTITALSARLITATSAQPRISYS
jgi:hypothetical protein